MRAVVWQLLLGYLPCSHEERGQELVLQRGKYHQLVQEMYPRLSPSQEELADTEAANPLWDLIRVDVIRTFPAGMEDLFANEVIRRCLCRILYIYSTVSQKGNYWQGLNEIPVPFLINFFSFYAGCSLRELNAVSSEGIEMALSSGNVEADVFWCVTRFVGGLQLRGEYVIGKNGSICEKEILQRFETLCLMADPELVGNLAEKGVEFIFFAFRWMICLLTRELPITAISRLWDSYIAEGENVVSFHLYTTLSFLLSFSSDIKACQTFDQTLMFIQRIPASHWTEAHAEFLVRCATKVKQLDSFYQQRATPAAAYVIVAAFSAASLVVRDELL